MKICIATHGVYSLPQPLVTLLQIVVADTPGQTLLRHSLRVTPQVDIESMADIYGNTLNRGVLPAGRVEIDYEAVVEVQEQSAPPLDLMEASLETLSADSVLMTLPSRYCPSDQLARLATTIFATAPSGVGRVQAICSWIRAHVTYEYGHSSSATTAIDTLTSGVGVCRDYAHLAITFCRALGIPARYVSGYCLDLEPPDFHGFFQAYLAPADGSAGAWYTFDGTATSHRPALIPIAFGRDAADTSMLTFYGTAEFIEQQVSVARCTDEAIG